MVDFFQNLFFNQISFITGFIAGALGLWLLLKLRPALPGLIGNIRSKSKGGGTRLISNNVSRLSGDTLRYTQGLHLASSLFALDEILVEPRFLAPPPQTEPGQEIPPGNILSQIIPYLPDWPELAARYSAETISLATALEAGDNLILIGRPGSGKTVALGHLIAQIARKEKPAEHLAGSIPVYTHVADLFPDKTLDQPALIHLRDAVHTYSDSLSPNKLESLLRQSLQSGKILLMVDGLDEVAPDLHQVLTQFLNALVTQFPLSRLIVTASPDYYGGLIELGLAPLAIAAWNEQQHLSFINKWSRSWYRHIRPMRPEGSGQIDPRLLNSWLLAENPIISPFDATLKAWAVFAGDAVGPRYSDSIESYVWRMTNHLENAREGLEDFALQLVAAQDISMDLKQARGVSPDQVFESDPDSGKVSQKSLTKRGKSAIRKLPGSIPELLENGLLTSRRNDCLSFCHPLIMAFFAACALSDAPISHFLSNQPDWTGKSLSLMFLAVDRDVSPEISELLASEYDPLLRNHLSIGRWLQYAPPTANWRSSVMRSLAAELQRSNLPLGLRARLLAALLLSSDPGVGVLLRQISHTSCEDLQLLSALGMGFLLDQASLTRLSELLVEPESLVSQAACFALVKIGNQQSLELLGSALLTGSDGIRRAASEALALDPGEGEEMLKEAAQMDDLLVRRSAVYGLAQVAQPWAEGMLNKLALEDKEWVVRSAATQIMEQRQEQKVSVSRVPPPLHEISWLIAFAGERGIGIAPGPPAENLLLNALAEGTPEQQQAALEALQYHPMQKALPQIYEMMDSGFGNIQQAAYTTLISYAAQGLDIQGPPIY